MAVVATPAVSRDVPIYLDGIGSAQALYTVTVRARVDGELIKVGFKEGEDVKKGDLIAQIDPRPFAIQLQQAEAALAKDEAALKNNRINLERNVALSAQKLVAQQAVDDQRSLAAQSEAAVQSDRAQVENARLQLTYARITAPIDGRTGVRMVDPGNIVHAGDAGGIVVIAQIDPIAVVFTLPEDNLPEVAAEMARGPLQVQAFSRDGQARLAEGKLSVIDNQINQQTGTVRLKAVFDNPKKALWPNQFVKARLLLETRKDALVVPTVAVQHGPQGTFAYVVKSDQTVEARPLTVDIATGDATVVAQGLAAGEQVITDGQYKLRPGARVTVRTAENRIAQRPGEAAEKPE